MMEKKCLAIDGQNCEDDLRRKSELRGEFRLFVGLRDSEREPGRVPIGSARVAEKVKQRTHFRLSFRIAFSISFEHQQLLFEHVTHEFQT